jgi:hypothetical protein
MIRNNDLFKRASISDKYTTDYLPKNEENEAENYYATVGIKACTIGEAIDSLIGELKEKKSIKRSIFNLVWLGVSVVTKIGIFRLIYLVSFLIM